MTIVGVVADVKQSGLDTPAIAQVYVPLAQDDTRPATLRPSTWSSGRSRAESLVADIRGAVQQLDRHFP